MFEFFGVFANWPAKQVQSLKYILHIGLTSRLITLNISKIYLSDY